MPPQDPKIEKLFNAARQLSSREERRAYLDVACDGDVALREHVERLLESSPAADAFFEERPVGLTGMGETAPIALRQETGPSEGPGQWVGRYKLLQKLGEGGFGIVYMAEQKEPVKRRVALKIIKLGMDTRHVVARFEAERQALAMMEHPNIAKVLDAGATNSGRPYFVMELVRGIPITQYCDEHQLATRERLELFIAVCHAIQHAHQKGVVHRDIKPSNILVTLHDGVPVPKVIDFGIAKATQLELTEKTVFTQFHQMIGTPAYMSPEQAEMSGLDIDTRSDIYSLGVLLYELLTGKTPLDGQDLLSGGYDEIRRRIKEEEPMKPSTRIGALQEAERTTVARHRRVDPSRLGSELKGDLDWIVMKCLEKDRTRRYETANAAALELRRYLAHEPVRARPPSASYRIRKFVHRNKVATVATACVVLALVAGLALSTWAFLREQNLRRQAVAARQEHSRLRQESEAARAAEFEQRRLAEANARKAVENEAHARQLLYASDMNLAQQALALNNLGWASDLLEKHRPGPEEPDLRGWEWRYIWQQCQSDALDEIGPRPGGIHSLSLSRDGRFLAVGEFGTGGLSVWDLDTRQPLAFVPDSAGVVLTAFSPREDWLAFTTEGKSSPTRHRETLRVWDMTLKQIIAELPLNGQCCGLAFRDDGTTLVAAQGLPDSELILWDVPAQVVRNRVPAPGLSGGAAARTSFALAPSATLAAHSAPDGGVRVVDVVTGEERWTARATDEIIVSLAFSPDATVLASGAGYGEKEVRLWDVSTGQRLGTLTGHRGYITHLTFWPDGTTLASASSDQTIRLWDLSDPTNPRPLKVLRGHRQEVWRLALLADERTLVSGAKDGTILVWDTAKDADHRQAVTIPSPVRGWCFAADSQSVVMLDPHGRVSRWTGDRLQDVRPLVEVGPAIFRAEFAEGGEFLATGSVDGVVTVWDLRRCELAHRLTVDSGPVAPGAVSSDGKRVWLGCFHRNTAEEWDLALGRALWSTGMPADTRFGLRSADGTWGLVVGSAGECLLRNNVSGVERRSNLQVQRPSNLAFSPDGSFFAVASYEGWAKLFETPTLKEVAVLRGFLQGVHSVAFSPDGRRLATGGSGSETIRLWDTGSGQQLLTLESGGSLFNQTAFAPDGSLLGSSSQFGVLHVWRAPGWREVDSRTPTLQHRTVDPKAVHDRPPTGAHIENEEQP